MRKDNPDKRVPAPLLTYSELPSTQSKAKEMIRTCVPEGTVVLAKCQTGGYGRQDRRWYSPAGGLWFSLILFPDCAPEKMALLSFAAGVASAKALEKVCAVKAELKWPNDILVKGKKAGGIIVDTVIENGLIRQAVVGIGINTNNRVPGPVKELAVSLRGVSGKQVPNARLLDAAVKGLHVLYKSMLKGRTRTLLKEYRSRLAYRNDNVVIQDRGQSFSGKLLGVDSSGRIIVSDRGNKERTFSAGTLRPAGEQEHG